MFLQRKSKHWIISALSCKSLLGVVVKTVLSPSKVSRAPYKYWLKNVVKSSQVSSIYSNILRAWSLLWFFLGLIKLISIVSVFLKTRLSWIILWDYSTKQKMKGREDQNRNSHYVPSVTPENLLSIREFTDSLRNNLFKAVIYQPLVKEGHIQRGLVTQQVRYPNFIRKISPLNCLCTTSKMTFYHVQRHATSRPYSDSLCQQWQRNCGNKRQSKWERSRLTFIEL